MAHHEAWAFETV